MKIRSVTALAKLSLPADEGQIARLGAFAAAAREAFTSAGYEVQTTRLATNLGAALARVPDPDNRVEVVKQLEATCQEAGFAYLSLGPTPPALLPSVAEILSSTEGIFATCHIVAPGTGVVHGDAIAGAAQVMLDAAQIEDGFGNLRFAALANVAAGTPFFPAAYWDQATPAFAIATESADLAVDACEGHDDAAGAHRALQSAIEGHATRIESVSAELGRAHHLAFQGIDFSLAPYPDPAVSIGGALENLSGSPLGAAGTLAAAATLTDAIHQAQFTHTGFCGLMMPVLEDNVLARRAAEGRFSVGDLLQWSSVCGTGLDTVPLPGDVTPQAIARLLFDVAALAVRLDKPLTARLMPLPGKRAGDPVHFDFPYFADGGVLPLEQGGTDAQETNLTRTQALKLSAYAKRI